MILTAIVLVITGFITYLWVTRGFFSSMINMICVVVAGAIAFAVWEPVSIALLNATPQRGFFQFVGDAAWGLGLVLPFALSAGLLRLALDNLLGANARVAPVADYIGGGACGLVAGVITSGFIVLGLGLTRGKADGLGYQRVSFRTGNGVGAVVRGSDKKLWIPVDTLTASLYEHMSLTSLRSSEPLGKWYPGFADVGPSNRLSLEEGKARNAMGVKDVDVIGSYVIGDPARPQSISGTLLQDKWDQAQKVVDLDGKELPTGHILGVGVSFRPGAKERKLAQVVIGNAQVRLLVQDAEGNTSPVYPFAVVTRARPDSSESTKVDYARFRFNSSRGFFPCSVGGETTVLMAFEFAVPAGHTPLAIYVKNVRKDVPASTSRTFAQMRDFDENAEILEILRDPLAAAPPPESETVGEQPDGTQRGGNSPTEIAGRYGIKITGAIGHTIQKGTEGSLKIAVEGRYNAVVEGQQIFERAALGNRGIGAKLRVDRFAADTGTVLVQVDVTPGQASSLVGTALENAEVDQPPLLVASNGATYQAVGFVYEDRTYVEVRYTRSVPIASLTEIQKQVPSRSRPDQKLVLLFRCSTGAEITGLRVGSKQLTYDTPFKLEGTFR